MADGFTEMVGSTQGGADTAKPASGALSDIEKAGQEYTLGLEKSAAAKKAIRERHIPEYMALNKKSADMLASMDSMNLSPPKPRENMPESPELKFRDPTEALGTIGATLAMFASLKSRVPFTAALNSGAEAMKAFHKGDAEQIQLTRDKFHNDMEVALRQNQEELNQWYAEMQKNSFDLTKSRGGLAALAAQYKAVDVQAAMEIGDVEGLENVLKAKFTTQSKAIETLEKSKEKAHEDEMRHEDRLAQIQANKETQAGNQQVRKDIAEMMWGAGGGTSGLTPEGDKVYNEFVKKGIPIPKTMRGRIDIDRLNKLGAEEEGGAGSGAIAGERAEYKGKSVAFNQITKDITAIKPYKEMLDINGDIAIKLGKDVIRTDSALANKSLNWLKQNMGDNPDTAEYLAQMRILTTESARVLNNPRLVGQLTDSARHEMEGIVNGNMPLEATERVIKRIQQDGTFRVQQMEKQANELRKDLGGGDNMKRRSTDATTTTPVNAKGWPLHTDKNGNKAYVSPDGKQFEEVKQ